MHLLTKFAERLPGLGLSFFVAAGEEEIRHRRQNYGRKDRTRRL